MIITQVQGTAVATLKDERLEGKKILVVAPVNANGECVGDPFLAVDLVGAGEGELVFVAQGSTARRAVGVDDIPADAAIVGILNSLSISGKTTYQKK